MKKSEELHCSFCGKKETEVLKLVAGPQVYICNECIAIANQIVNDSQDNHPPTVQPSVIRKLLIRFRQFWHGDTKQRIGSFSVPS